MPNEVIHIRTRMSREELKEVIRSIPGSIAGTSRDSLRLHKGFIGRVAKVFFEKVYRDFDLKSVGSRGSDDAEWARNTPRYLAYGKGTKQERMGRGQMPMNRPGGPAKHGNKLGRGRGTGELTGMQLKQWRTKYVERRNFYQTLDNMSHPEAKKRAAQDAWKYMSHADTKFKRFGERGHLRMRSSDKLYKSLQVGSLTDEGGYAGTYVKKNKDQWFKDNRHKFEVGTKVPYAKYHHEGRGAMPERRLWPEELPEEWMQDIVQTFKRQIVALAESLQR